jgi:hypothetical protein
LNVFNKYVIRFLLFSRHPLVLGGGRDEVERQEDGNEESDHDWMVLDARN